MSWIDNLVAKMAQEEINKAKLESEKMVNKVCSHCGCEMDACEELWEKQRKCCPDCKCTKRRKQNDKT